MILAKGLKIQHMNRSYSVIEKKRLLTQRSKVKPFHYLVLFYATIILVGIPIRILKIDALTVIFSLLSLILIIIGCAFLAVRRKLSQSEAKNEMYRGFNFR